MVEPPQPQQTVHEVPGTKSYDDHTISNLKFTQTEGQVLIDCSVDFTNGLASDAVELDYIQLDTDVENAITLLFEYEGDPVLAGETVTVTLKEDAAEWMEATDYTVTSASAKPISVWKVTFYDDDLTTVIDTQDVLDGSTAREVTEPEKPDYKFIGWYVIESGVVTETEFNFYTPVEDDVDVAAVYESME